jgi:hypothetical protein
MRGPRTIAELAGLRGTGDAASEAAAELAEPDAADLGADEVSRRLDRTR